MGVDQVDLVGRHAAALERHLHRPRRADAGLDRLDHVPAIGGRAVADDLGIDLGAARLGGSRSSRNSDPAPSPSTKPSRVVERAGHRRGRLARARQAHPAHVREAGVRDLEEGASVDPEMTAMQSPRRIASAASPTLWVPVAQADTMHTLWPIAPVSMAIIPDVLSVRAFAMNVRRPSAARALAATCSCRSSSAGHPHRSRR